MKSQYEVSFFFGGVCPATRQLRVAKFYVDFDSETPVYKEILEGSQQERAKSPTRRIGRGEQLRSQQVREKALRQILGLFDRADFSANEGVKRIPIRFAQRGQGLFGFGRAAAGGPRHRAPIRGDELIARWQGVIHGNRSATRI